MTRTKPKYEDLTSEQVCDLIATKVMGWHKDFGKCHWWDPKTNTLPFAIYGVKVTGLPVGWFDPTFNLNDCFLAEEKLTDEQWDRYIASLFAVVGGCYEYRKVIHATASQRCKALLLAIGEVER